MALPPPDPLLIFNALPDATLLLSPELRIEAVSDAYLAATLTRRDALVGQHVFAAMPDNPATPEAHAVHNLRASLERVLATGQAHEMAQQRYDVPDPARPGEFVERHWLPRNTPVLDAQGRVQHILHRVHDVTAVVAGNARQAAISAELVLARRQREAERERLHQLFREAPAPIVIFDGPRHVFQLVNPAYQRLFPGRALLGQSVLDALPELRGTSIDATMDGVYDTGTTFVAQEMPLQMTRTPDGPLEDLYFTFTFQARHNDQGQVDGILMFGNEVTDQVQARRVVEQREVLFRRMADHVPGTLWVTNSAGECTYLNARWYATTGQTQAEGLGLGWTNAVHPDDAPGTGATFLAANARREPFSCLFRLRQRDGAYRWVTDQGQPRYGATGAYQGMVGAVVDVHEQKLAELALQQLSTELSTANEQLTRTNVDLDNFIYTASHDLRAPISNIEGLLYLLQQELPAAVAQDALVGSTLARMLDSVERFKRTIDHLTDVSKLQNAHLAPAAAVNLAAVVDDVRQDLTPLLQEAGAKLVVDVGAHPPVQFSEKNLRSIVYNLLSNALKYRSPDRPPRIDLRAHVRAGHTVLEVHDN
ncbi:PAS domain-containing protein, partial [Hymenobacter sp. B1770]|uniref:PAS domain-containing sensor histidine kinase n=1 Tax=Hymenobacter sp. B1770 TaxID=1718788 RepID=UPI003CF64667